MPRLASHNFPPASPQQANSAQASERGLAAEGVESRRRLWLEENREAMEAWNEHLALHGLPLAAFRQF
jgi:antitoxin CcdA